MENLRQAIHAVQRNLTALGLYIGMTVIPSVLVLGVSQFFWDDTQDISNRPGLILLSLAMDIFLVVTSAFAQSIVFSRIGKNVDRPLWKIENDREAVRRYFLLWAGLNAMLYLCKDMAFVSYKVFGDESLAAFFDLLLTVCVVCYIPVGAALMFGGRIKAASLGENLRPLFRQFGQVLVVMLFSGAVFFFAQSLQIQTDAQYWLWPLIDIVTAYFDCVIFTAIWLICIYDRQNPEEVELDF